MLWLLSLVLYTLVLMSPLPHHPATEHIVNMRLNGSPITEVFSPQCSWKKRCSQTQSYSAGRSCVSGFGLRESAIFVLNRIMVRVNLNVVIFKHLSNFKTNWSWCETNFYTEEYLLTCS